MKTINNENQLDLVLERPTSIREVSKASSCQSHNTVSLQDYKSNRARSVLVEQLSRSGLIGWKLDKEQSGTT